MKTIPKKVFFFFFKKKNQFALIEVCVYADSVLCSWDLSASSKEV